MDHQIYLDNAASTKVDGKVLKAMLPYFSEKYGNASSKHQFGKEARNALEKSRKVIAEAINAKTNELIFTSGGTESNNLVLKGLFFYHKVANTGKKHIVTTKIEHESILETCKWLEKQGAKVTYLDVDKEGFIDMEELEKKITKDTILISIIHGNNEIGTIQDLEKIGKICKEKKVLFHTDACQSFTKVPLNVKKQNLDLVTLNSHKIHGPKGVGALYIRDGIKITPLMHGGGHEKGLRSGTENISGIVGFAEAVRIANPIHIKKMEKLRDKLIEGVLKISNIRLNGPRPHNSPEAQPKQFIKNKSLREKRLCNNINVSFMNTEGEAIAGYLEREGIYASTGSACQSHNFESSHVLKALGLTDLEANSSIRMSISKYTTEQDVDYALNKLKKVIGKLRI